MKSNVVIPSLKRSLTSWLLARGGKPRRELTPIWVFGREPKKIPEELRSVPAWQWQEARDSKKPVVMLTTDAGLVWVVRPFCLGDDEPKGGHGGRLGVNGYIQGRDSVGQALGQAMERNSTKGVRLTFNDVRDDVLDGALVAVDLAAYQFRRVMKDEYPGKLGLMIEQNGRAIATERLKAASQVARAVNVARQLVNLPANLLNPVTAAQSLKTIWGQLPGMKVTVLGPKDLARERMHLVLAVGQGSATPPHVVHLSYRPKGAKGRKVKRIAFVGKGITFDTGGVNLKPDSGMRLMKKDMGGAAAVAGLAWWVAESRFPLACDFYLALAENAVGSRSFRPGDLIESRSGHHVEIHNTDAEGRLVLADAMDWAVESKPDILVDVATLTGAIKAGLGSQVAGLFGNDDRLVDAMAKAAAARGDWVWPMPLYRRYKSALKSTIADFQNAGDGFGGAITAALFLENFVQQVPWLHLDIYAWKDSAEGAITESGASGQPVQALIEWLMSLATQSKS